MFLSYPMRLRGLHGRKPQHSGINHRPGEEKLDGTSMPSHKDKLASDRALFTYSG